jgi:hypothetical protein
MDDRVIGFEAHRAVEVAINRESCPNRFLALLFAEQPRIRLSSNSGRLNSGPSMFVLQLLIN